MASSANASDLLAGIGRRSLEDEPMMLTMSKGKYNALEFEEKTGFIERRVLAAEKEMRDFEANALDDTTLAANAAAAAAAAAAGDDVFRGGARRDRRSTTPGDGTAAAYARASISKLAAGFDDCPLPPNPYRYVPKAREKTTLFVHRPQLVRELDSEAGAMQSDELDPRWSIKLQARPGEIRCPNCGTAHRNPRLKDIYRFCHHCMFIMRQPDELAMPPPDELAKAPPLFVLIATYGDPHNALRALDITDALRKRVEKFGLADRFVIQPTEDLHKTFGDPAPGCAKVLRVRYVIRGVRGEVYALEERPGHLSAPFMVAAPHGDTLLFVKHATYGHPRGMIKGRGAFNITELVQARVDASGGRFLEIRSDEKLGDIFSDPSPGMHKHLTVEYEIVGTGGSLHSYEMDGRLLETLHASALPVVAPQVVILAATYGYTAELIAERKRVLTKELYELQAIRHRRVCGLTVSREQNKRLRKMPELQQRLKRLATIRPGSTDVLDVVQRRIETHGGGNLLFLNGRDPEPIPEWAKTGIDRDGDGDVDADDFEALDDLNALFGDPTPEQPKLLDIKYLIMGHDSDKQTSDDELTRSGYPRNYIRGQDGRVTVEAENDDYGRAYLETTILLGAPPTLPVLEVRRATYGHCTDLTKMFDVTQEVRKIADAQGGFRLDITPDDDLERLFRDPCPGIRKQLKIGYMVRGFSGTLRLDEHPMNHLRASLRIGYPPDAAEDPFRPKAAQAPKLVSMGRVLALQTPKIDARIQIREVTTTLDPGYLDMLAKLANEEKLLELREEKKKRKAERAEKRAKHKALLAELEAADADSPSSRPTTPAPS